MPRHADIRFHNNAFLISGDLGFCNVMHIYERSLSQVQRCHELNFDFAQVTSSNSAGLALIIEWLKCAKQHNKPINFTNLSPDLLAIAKAAGIDNLIPYAMGCS